MHVYKIKNLFSIPFLLCVFVCVCLCVCFSLCGGPDVCVCGVCTCMHIYMGNAHVHEWQKWCQVACSITLCHIPYRKTVPELEDQCCKGDSGSACLCLTVLWLKACTPYFAFMWMQRTPGTASALTISPTQLPLLSKVYTF